MAKVTRIKASDTKKSAPKKATPKKAVKAKKVEKTPSSNPFVRALQGIAEYFVGAWYELRQVRWPTRRATWELTLAVILFSAFFAVIILLLDALFKFLFELLLA